MSNLNLYEQTLNDLERRRAQCREDLRKIEAAIAGLRGAMEITVNIVSAPPVVAAVSNPAPLVEEDTKQLYANISVRWGILKLLSFTLDPLSSAEISSVLVAGGNPRAIRPTVSAVISDMVNKRNEVQADEKSGGYWLTANGAAAWKAIESSERYVNRAAYANEQQQPA